MEFYYLHIQAGEINRNTNEMDTYTINFLPSDTLFQSDGFWGFPVIEELAKDEKNKITFIRQKKMATSENIVANNQKMPDFLSKIVFTGIPGEDDFGVYKNSYLVVSLNGLTKLRKLGVINAESDLITDPIDTYFNEHRDLFWMPEPVRNKFINKFLKTK